MSSRAFEFSLFRSSMALALLSHHGALDFNPALSLAAFVLYMLLSLPTRWMAILPLSQRDYRFWQVS